MSYVTQDPNALVERRPTLSLPVPFLGRTAASGDLLASMSEAVGIRACSSCEDRRRWLNERLVFRPWSRSW